MRAPDAGTRVISRGDGGTGSVREADGGLLRRATETVLVFALCGALTACASPGGTLLPASVSLSTVKAFVVAESGYDAAVETADLAINSGQLPVATISRIKALADTGHGYVVAGRAAVQAADASNIIAETSALTSLVSQLSSLSKGTSK